MRRMGVAEFVAGEFDHIGWTFKPYRMGPGLGGWLSHVDCRSQKAASNIVTAQLLLFFEKCQEQYSCVLVLSVPH